MSGARHTILRKTQSFPDEFSIEPRYIGEPTNAGVEPMLLALSMELALKAWFVFDYDHTKFPRSHDLMKLFNALKIETQQRLDNEFKKSVVPFHPNLLYPDFGIQHVLFQNKDAFTDWRYLHERKKNLNFEQSTFEATLEMVLIEFRKLYHVEEVPNLHKS